jgi:hypothetical protein
MPHAVRRMPPFQVAGGSIRGRNHERSGGNNQDALAWSQTDRYVLAVVCDGCGSGAHSEVGARLGARLVLESLRAWAPALPYAPVETVLEQVRLCLLSQLSALAQAMGGNVRHTIQDYFLFTIVGAVITPHHAIVFTLGDGAVAVNGAYTYISYPGNAPPYLAYGLVGDAVAPPLRPYLAFQVHWHGRPEDVRELLLGSDGVHDLYSAAHQSLPGRTEPVGALAQFWREDRYFTNPYGITRRLALINRPVTRYAWEQRRVQHTPGLLADDTTLVVMRRTPHSQQEA